MSGFFSANVTSPFPDENILFNSASGITGQQIRQNDLMNQGRQLDLSNANMEQVGRAAAGLLSAYPDEASRAAAYPRVVGMLQSQGSALHAPAQYPGEAALRSLVSQTIPVEDQYKLGIISPPGLTDALTSSRAPLPGQPGYGGATAAPGTAPTGAGTATIGQRQNNPGNLTFAGQPGASPGQGNRFASFPDMPSGVAATADQLAIYQQQHGINTVRGAVTRWVSDPKADLGSYIGDVSKAIGVGPDDKIDLTDPAVQAKFIQAQFPHESAGGGFVLNPADVAKGVQMAAANRGRAVQAPGTAIATAAPATAQPGQPVPTQVAGPPMVSTAPPGSTAAPGAPAQPTATPPTGVNSPQFQAALELNHRAAALETQFPNSPAAKAQAASLRAQAALYMQADSVSVDPVTGIQTKQLTGERLNAAAPNAHYVWNQDQGAYVDTTGVHPPVTPPSPRLTQTKGGDILQSKPGGGATVVYSTNPQDVATQAAAQAQGSGVGGDVAKQLPAMITQARNAAQQEGQIDYASNQLREAAKGGIPTGYFSDALATAAAAAKSLGIDTSSLGVNPEAVGNMQTAQKTLSVIGGAIIRQALGPGSAITDGKVEQFIHTQPGIQNDPQALQRIMAWARSQYTYEREMGQAAVAEAAKSPTGTLPLSWQAQYYRDHGFAPIYDPVTQEMRQPDGRQPERETPSAAPTARVPREGDTATGKDGHKIVLRGGQWVPQ